MTHEFHSYYYDRLGIEPVWDSFTLPPESKLTESLLTDILNEFVQNHVPRYDYLDTPFKRQFEVYRQKPREDWKPDNHLAANFCRQITETFEGYFIGVPVDIRLADEAQQDWLRLRAARVNQADIDASISRGCSKYGNAYELLYQDTDGEASSAYVDPRTGFVVYDDTVAHKPMYGVTFYYDEDGHRIGNIYTNSEVIPFSDDGDMRFADSTAHDFGSVPLIEYVQNDDREGLYESVLSLVDAFNSTLSEKKNDIDYFADAYLLITGVEMPDDWKEDLRKYKIINLWGDANIDASFLTRPSSDAAQENLLSRLETLIHKTSMVPDITDESFYTASGAALTKRLMPMDNMAKTKERKFTASIRNRLHILSQYPKNGGFSEWDTAEIVMKRNMPDDIETEARVAGSLSGIVSEKTQLSTLSFVNDPETEIERKRQEKEATAQVMAPSRIGEQE